MWVRNGMTLGTKWYDLGTKWYDLGTKWYGLGYEMVWDESAWVRNDLLPSGRRRPHHTARSQTHTLSMIHNPMYNKRPLGLTAPLSNCICYTNDV